MSLGPTYPIKNSFLTQDAALKGKDTHFADKYREHKYLSDLKTGIIKNVSLDFFANSSKGILKKAIDAGRKIM
jgi:hypothetical protein